MAQGHRLDPVIKLRERAENKARTELADAQRNAAAAANALSEAQKQTQRDERKFASAVEWQLIEGAHARALLDARLAEVAEARAREQVATTRTVYTTAHSQADAVRRIVDIRQQEFRRAAQQAEDKLFDEVATLRYARAGR